MIVAIQIDPPTLLALIWVQESIIPLQCLNKCLLISSLDNVKYTHLRIQYLHV